MLYIVTPLVLKIKNRWMYLDAGWGGDVFSSSGRWGSGWCLSETTKNLLLATGLSEHLWFFFFLNASLNTSINEALLEQPQTKITMIGIPSLHEGISTPTKTCVLKAWMPPWCAKLVVGGVGDSLMRRGLLEGSQVLGVCLHWRYKDPAPCSLSLLPTYLREATSFYPSFASVPFAPSQAQSPVAKWCRIETWS